MTSYLWIDRQPWSDAMKDAARRYQDSRRGNPPNIWEWLAWEKAQNAKEANQ